jgi:signal transduction histidine kinase
MAAGVRQWLGQLDLSARFMLASLLTLLVGMAAVGVWVSHQIEEGVVQRTAATTALYVGSLIAQPLQDLSPDGTLPTASVDRLDWLLEDTPLGQEVREFRVWDPTGRIVYGTDRALVGQTLPIEDDLAEAFAGRVVGGLGEPEGSSPAGAAANPLIEIYSPVRRAGGEPGGSPGNDIVAVAEFYYPADELVAAMGAARGRTWLVLGAATLAIYGALTAFVQRAAATIAAQQAALAEQVARLTDLLAQNAVLHGRVQGAAARTTALNERFLRRFSAELHDGPAQEISLALLRLDAVAARCADHPAAAADLEHVEASLRRALGELRSASSGLLLPQLAAMSVTDTVKQAARAHRTRTGSAPDVLLVDLPDQAPLATKIALYRIVQEALSNAARHAPGTTPRVRAWSRGDELHLEIGDDGPGFDPAGVDAAADHLGIMGMRERAESLGGAFRIESAFGTGVRVAAVLPAPKDGSGHGPGPENGRAHGH